MAYGKGTYGSAKGRPSKAKKKSMREEMANKGKRKPAKKKT